MSRNRQARAPRTGAAGRSGRAEQVLDLDRYVPALITFIANKLSRSATVVYQKRFGVNVTEWRILSLLAIEPEISAARICHVIGFDKGPVSRTLAGDAWQTRQGGTPVPAAVLLGMPTVGAPPVAPAVATICG